MRIGAALLCLIAGGAFAAEPSPAPARCGYWALLGGAGPAYGSLDAFTQQSASSQRASDSRPWSGASAIAARLAIWGKAGSPWGAPSRPPASR